MKIPQTILEMSLSELSLTQQEGSILLEIAKKGGDPATQPARLVETTVEKVMERWNKYHDKGLLSKSSAICGSMNYLFQALISKGCPRKCLEDIPSSLQIFTQREIKEQDSGEISPWHTN